MIKILPIIFYALFFSIFLHVIDIYFSKACFLKTFLLDQSFSIMVTVLAIYIAATGSFISILLNREKEKGRVIFSNTRKELKENFIFVFSILAIHFIFLIPLSNTSNKCTDISRLLFQRSGIPPANYYEFASIPFSVLATSTFILFIYALYEISTVLFVQLETD